MKLKVTVVALAAQVMFLLDCLPVVSAEGHTDASFPTDATDSDSVFLWSSTGGGWRAQMACGGFANLFQKAGLLGEESSLFHSVVSPIPAPIDLDL